MKAEPVVELSTLVMIIVWGLLLLSLFFIPESAGDLLP